MPGSIVISSGHGEKVRGASGYIDEVDEARKVVDEVAKLLDASGVTVYVFHDNVSTSQNENLNRIVDYHNSKTRGLDVSVHFNANQTTDSPVGCEVLYATQNGFNAADPVVDAICDASGLKNRGPKERNDLFFLNQTDEPAILIEVCFVDSKADVEIYKEEFGAICRAIADTISGETTEPVEGFAARGSCSSFGGPDDTGVSPSEGLAFISSVDQNQFLFLPTQPAGTTGLARRLNPYVHYVACRWDYDKTSKEMLRSGKMAKVTAVKTGVELLAFPADWGPNENTGRVADLSPGLLTDLGIGTDDEVEVVYPYEEK